MTAGSMTSARSFVCAAVVLIQIIRIASLAVVPDESSITLNYDKRDDPPETFQAFLLSKNDTAQPNPQPKDIFQWSEGDVPASLVITDKRNESLAQAPARMWVALKEILESPDIALVAPADLESGSTRCNGPCSTLEECDPMYNCFFTAIADAKRGYWPDAFATCMQDVSPTNRSCLFRFDAAKDWRSDCVSPYNFREPGNWTFLDIDTQLQILLHGGRDRLGIYWPAPREGESGFLRRVGESLLDNPDFSCSLQSVCDQPISCHDIGSRLNIALGSVVAQSMWGARVIKSLGNINRQLSNQYQAIQGGAISAALATPGIDNFLPQPKKTFGLLKALEGIGTIFAAVGGFVPALAGPLGAAGVILPAIGSTIEQSLTDAQSGKEDIAAEEFFKAVSNIYGTLIASLDNVTQALFRGEDVLGVNITQMMSGGGWVDRASLTAVPDAERQMKIDIISRGINGLWKTFSSNKMWVLFVYLNEESESTAKCKADTLGPEESRYCADGGVYYTYNYVEDGDHQGHLDRPWGGDKLSSIDNAMNLSWVTEASAKTYRLARTMNAENPFNISGAEVSNGYLKSLVAKNDASSLLDSAGKYPGSWTLPVCDASIWGGRWNQDYTKGHDKDSHPPCICGPGGTETGPGGTETGPWAIAAGMKDFDTYSKKCRDELSDENKWPDGIASVDLGSGNPVMRGDQMHSPLSRGGLPRG